MSRLTRILPLAIVLFAITAAPSAAHELTVGHAKRTAAAQWPAVVHNLAVPFGGFTPQEFGFGNHVRTNDHRVVIEIIAVDWGGECVMKDDNEECVVAITKACSVLMPVRFPEDSHGPPLKWKAVVEGAYLNKSESRPEGCLSGKRSIPKRIRDRLKPLPRPDNARERTRQPRR
jgi:hypothetical protein